MSDFTPKEELLFRFSEWLDTEGIMGDPGDDKRSHMDLALEFLHEQERV